MPAQDDDGRRSYAYFGVRGDFDPAALAFEMGLIPQRCVRKHSKDPDRGLPRSSLLRFAEVVSPADDRGAADVYDLARAVVAGLDGRSGPIAAALRGSNAVATLQVVLYLYPGPDGAVTPAIGFDAAVVRFLAAVGASIDVDSYWL